MSLLQVYASAALVILALMTALWLLSLRLRNAGIVDVFWGLGFVAAAWLAFTLAAGAPGARQWLLVGLVTIWGVRLALHILRRNWGKPEDFRYAKWRRDHGSRWWWRSFFEVFLLQGALLCVIAAPLVAGQTARPAAPLGVLDFVGAACWLVGFGFEAGGDAQLARFRADPANRGKLLTTGLWRYTRHPNYFGDAAQWWGYYLIAVAAGAVWTIFSPLLMTYLLLRVSGVAMLERTLADSKPGYRDYIERTSAFVPWFPRHKTPPGGVK